MKQNSTDTNQTLTNETSDVNASYLWKLPSAQYRLDEIKNANNLQSFESPTFQIDSFDCHLELYPNGCNRRNKGQIKLFICINSIPEPISSIVLNIKFLVKETNTSAVKRVKLSRNKLHCCWLPNTLEFNKIKHLNELTFEAIMSVRGIDDISGNIMGDNTIDFTKEQLVKQMIFTEQRLEDASEYLLSQCKVKTHIYFDPEGWLYEVGVIYYNNGNYIKAIEACLKAASDGDELLVIGQAYQDLNELEKAIEYYEQYMREFPAHGTKIMNVPSALVCCYNAMKHFEKANEWSLKGTKIDAKEHNGVMLKKVLENFNERDPKHYANIGSTYRKLGNNSNNFMVKSKEFWIKGLMRHPNDIPFNLDYAYHLRVIDNPRRSLFYLRKIIKKDAQRIDVLIAIMKALTILNKVDECIKVISVVMNLIKRRYEMKLNKEEIVDSDSYTCSLNKSKEEKTKLLIMYQFQLLNSLRSIAPGTKYMSLFREVLDFIITINKEFSTDENMLRIVEWLLYLKDIKRLQVIYDEWKNWTVKALKKFAFVYYQLNEYTKSIEILLRALDIQEAEKEEQSELTGCYYGLCLNYLELNNNDMYKEYHALVLERESKFIKLDSWDKYFNFDDNNGKYSVTDPDIDIKLDFDPDNSDEFEKPQQSVIEQWKWLELKTDEKDERQEMFEEIKEKYTDTDPVVINYCHDLEWQLVNQWYEMAISTSAHSLKWNELYLECLLNLKRYADVIEYIQMFSLDDKLCNVLLLEIGNYYYWGHNKFKTALKYYNLIQGVDSEKVIVQKARCHKRLNHTIKAIQYYLKLLSSNAFGYFYNKCLSELSDFLFYKVGDFENAKRFLLRGLWLNHSDTDILGTYASWLELGRATTFDDSLTIYTKILNLDSSKDVSFVNAAITFNSLNQNKKAIDLTVHSILVDEANKQCTISFANLGHLYFELYKQHLSAVNRETLTLYLNESRKYLKYSLIIDDSKKLRPHLHYSYANLLFFGFKKFRFAEVYYENALRMMEKCQSEDILYFDIQYRQQCLLNYGKLLRVLKKYEKSNEHLNNAIDFKMHCQSKTKYSFECYDECQHSCQSFIVL